MSTTTILMMTEPTLPARERILETAASLFYREGFRAVGIDTIIAESGVAKMTLYRHYPSKDDLIVAYLERAHTKFWQAIQQAIAPYAGQPVRQLEAIFEWVAHIAISPTCLGCTFMGAANEFPELTHQGHQVGLAHKRAVLNLLAELAAEAGARQPTVLAAQLLLLMDGAWNAARMFGPGNHGAEAASAAQTLIAAQTHV
ncbi:MAG: TetR/AcrR family transcriptional regulator [Chloroflexi bacterium]|nr:TetR/AcrR family transcriptional regulator [Chloroflexota bacterium]